MSLYALQTHITDAMCTVSNMHSASPLPPLTYARGNGRVSAYPCHVYRPLFSAPTHHVRTYISHNISQNLRYILYTHTRSDAHAVSRSCVWSVATRARGGWEPSTLNNAVVAWNDGDVGCEYDTCKNASTIAQSVHLWAYKFHFQKEWDVKRMQSKTYTYNSWLENIPRRISLHNLFAYPFHEPTKSLHPTKSACTVILYFFFFTLFLSHF